MLFDLSGKRRRVVQVVYATLAILMGGSLVLFGIGSDAPGGILDAVGLGGDGGGTSSPQYEEQIEDAENNLETDPENTAALLNLTRYHFLSATQSGVTRDPETGIPDVSEDARQELEEAVDAWNRYLATKPERENATVAGQAAEAFRLLNDADGAAAAQRIVAESQKTATAYYQLALYLYADGKIAQGDAAGQQAVEAAEPSERKQIEMIVEQLGEQARKQKKQLEKLPEGGAGGGGGQQLEDPFGALGGGTGVTPAPAP